MLSLMYDTCISKNPLYMLAPRANTRQADKIAFVTDIIRYEIYQKSPYYVGCNLWNTLPADIQKMPNLSSFKSEIRKLYRVRNAL